LFLFSKAWNTSRPTRQILKLSLKSYHFKFQKKSLHLTQSTLFNLPELPNLNFINKKWEHSEKKLLGYSMQQMYDIVYDVEKYSEFVPWCKSCMVTQRRDQYWLADMTVGFGPITETFESHLTVRPDLIKAESKDGKILNHMITLWKFQQGLPNNKQSCIVDFYVSFQFKSIIHNKLLSSFFDEVVENLSIAFIKRAETIHGQPSIEYQIIR